MFACSPPLECFVNVKDVLEYMSAGYSVHGANNGLDGMQSGYLVGSSHRRYVLGHAPIRRGNRPASSSPPLPPGLPSRIRPHDFPRRQNLGPVTRNDLETLMGVTKRVDQINVRTNVCVMPASSAVPCAQCASFSNKLMHCS